MQRAANEAERERERQAALQKVADTYRARQASRLVRPSQVFGVRSQPARPAEPVCAAQGDRRLPHARGLAVECGAI